MHTTIEQVLALASSNLLLNKPTLLGSCNEEEARFPANSGLIRPIRLRVGDVMAGRPNLISNPGQDHEALLKERGLNDGEVEVLLIDLALPDGSGIDLIREASAKRPELKIIVYVDSRHLEMVSWLAWVSPQRLVKITADSADIPHS